MAVNRELGPFEQVILQTIEGNTAMVQKWIEGKPGSWGFLAGKAVIAYRKTWGRTLTDWERREVWHVLWTHLLALKQGSGTGLLAQFPLDDT
jgi:hypothetical protein